MVQLTEKQKYDIILKNEKGYSSRKIAEELCINKKTVLKWISVYKNTGFVKKINNGGRKRKTNNEIDKFIIDTMIQNNLNISLNVIKEILLCEKNINISRNTIRNRLVDPKVVKLLD